MLVLLCFFLLFQCSVGLSGAYERKVIKTLTVSNGGPKGAWHRPHMCPPGSYAAAFDQRIEPRQGSGDDTGGNAVKLFCKTKANIEVATAYSYEGLWGSWTGRQDCIYLPGTTEFITSFSLKVEAYMSSRGDDSAMNNMRVRCRPFEAGGDGYSLEGRGGPKGDWGYFSASCPANSAVCGLAVRFRGYEGKGDDSALNDIKMYCCID